MDLKGKVINFLGDSITEGVGVSDINNRYYNVVLNKCGLKAVNAYAISGSRFAHQSKPSEKPRYDLCFCGRVFDIDPNADIVVVFGGTNDYIHGDAYIGSKADNTSVTFYGAVEFLMSYLKENFKNKPIVFITPGHINYKDIIDIKPSQREMKREDAMPLKNYVEIIENKAKQHNISVLNLYENLGINPNNPEDKEKYTFDGLHFNDLGHKMIAERLIELLNKL